VRWASADDAGGGEAFDYLMVGPLGLTLYFGDNGLRLASLGCPTRGQQGPATGSFVPV